MGILKRLFKARDKPDNKVSGGWSFLFGGTTSGKPVNERTAMQTTAVYGWVSADSVKAIGQIPTTPAFVPYLVKVTTDVLNIRKGLGTDTAIVGSIKDKGVYTVVE